MTTLTPIPERLAKLDEIELAGGGHDAPPASCDKPEGCDQEILSWLFGWEWTDHPEHVSPVLSAFRRRFNDGLPHDQRQRLKASMLRCVGTAGDGQDEARGWLAADWAVRTALPTFLELAGVSESAEALRALPELNAETYTDERRELVSGIRREMWGRREAKLAELREKVREVVTEELKRRGAPWAAEAAEAAEAAGAAEAAWATRARVRKAVRDAIYPKAKAAIEEKIAPAREGVIESAFELLERMIDPSAVSEGATP